MKFARHLSWLFTLPLALLAVSFAISNRGHVALELWPLPFTMEVPLFALVLAVVVLGFLLGGLVAWMGQHSHRRAERQHQSRADRLARELEQAKTRATAAEARLAELTAPPTAATPPAIAAGAPVAAAPNSLVTAG